MTPLEEETILTCDLIAHLQRSRNRLQGELDAVDAELRAAEASLLALELQQHRPGEGDDSTPVLVQYD